jgi:hypothetical protein
MKIFRNMVLVCGLTWSVNAQIPDFTPSTPLIGAVMYNDTATAKRLLAEGANPNEKDFFGFKPIFFPTMQQNLELLRIMVAKGADVNVRDASGATTLMWAAFNEAGETPVVDELLKLGVDPNASNKAGETALVWARRRGSTAVVAALKKAGASETASIRESAEKAISLLQTSGAQFVKVSGCTSCHNQSLPQMAFASSRARGLAIDEEAARKQVLSVIAMVRPMREEILRSKERLPDPGISVSYILLGLAAENYQRDANTDAMTQLITQWQLEDGSFPTIAMRPPMEASKFTATALSLRALQLYGTDPAERIARARTWLRLATPKTNEDRAMRLLGLAWSNASTRNLHEAAQDLIAKQRPDGGWAQVDTIETDSYATGQALVALSLSGQVEASSEVYQRGVDFLLRTQYADGSWLVRSRTFPLQPYKESGFPHGKDQWISASGTSWAVMALSMALPVVEHEAGSN